MVFTHHTLWEEYCHYLPFVSHSVGQWLARTICGYFFRRASAIVSPSQDVARQGSLSRFQHKVQVVPTGIDPEEFRGGDADSVFAELGLEADTPLFIFVGRMAREKSIDFLLRAFQRVNRENPRARFLLIGAVPRGKP